MFHSYVKLSESKFYSDKTCAGRCSPVLFIGLLPYIYIYIYIYVYKSQYVSLYAVYMYLYIHLFSLLELYTFGGMWGMYLTSTDHGIIRRKDLTEYSCSKARGVADEMGLY